MPDTVVVALGGNAILRPGQDGTIAEQFGNVQFTCASVVGMIHQGHRVVITHGNGPQVGNLLIQNAEARGLTPPMPLDVCGAMTQGMIGYLMQQSLYNDLVRANIEKSVVTVLTRTAVNERDPAFQNPTKPIGPFRSQGEAERAEREEGQTWVEDAGRGWRRVVPSPDPMYIVEGETIRRLVNEGMIVIAVGGGGIPVARRPDYTLEGVEGVVDKDLASARLAIQLRADVLMMLTDVEFAALHYGTPQEEKLGSLTVAEARAYEADGHFRAGSMAPKIRAAIEFAQQGGRSVITDLEHTMAGWEGRTGTQVHPG